jgi:glycosyltransferase involved in cell wall biosynthesis
MSNSKILIYIPTRNTANTLEETYRRIANAEAYDYIVVDNGSEDESVAIAERLGLRVIRHHFDRGYGGTQKTAYSYALGRDSDIVVMLHSDGQYAPELLPKIVKPISEGHSDAVFGSRILGRKALEGGMPYWKYISNRFLTWIENKALGTNLSEFHSGYRAYSLSLLSRVPFLYNSDNWLFDSEIIFQIKNLGFRITEIPIPTTYSKSASSVSFFDGVIYGLSIFLLIFKYLLHKGKIIRFKQFM